MKFQRSILFFFIVAVLIITRFIVHSYDIHKHNLEISNWVNRSNEVIKNIERVYGTTAEIESGYRGYVITGEKSFTTSCNDAARLVNKELGIIKDLTKDNPPQQENAAALGELVNQKIFYSCTVIRLRDSSAKAAMQLISAGRGRQLMTDIQARINIMLAEENRLLVTRMAESDRAEKHSFDFSLFGGLCSLAFLMLFLYRLNRDIQLRKQAESELKSSEIKYRRLIEDAGAVMFTTDLNGHFTFISNRVLSLTGYRKEELLGLLFSSLVAPEWVEKVSNHYRSQFRQNTPETVLEFPIITKEKTRKWVEQTGVILYGEEGSIKGLQCIVKDIDERKRIQLELEASEYQRKENQYRLESILNHSTSLIFIKDLEGRYLLINKRFESVFNISNDRISGKTDYDFNPRTIADKYSAADKWVLDNKKPREEEEIIAHPDGDHHYMIIKFPLFDNKNEIYGL
ncbi:MAG TPA: CHASE3 domain-containing protein, partial [Chitinophagaceae bacterium]